MKLTPASRALVLAALLLAPLLPTTLAGVPQPEPWAPYDAISNVNRLAIAAEGTTLAAALARGSSGTSSDQPQVPGTGSTRVATTDLAILTTDHGHVTNGSSTAAPLGRSHVAVSRTGEVVASLGNQTYAHRPTELEGILTLQYARVPDGTNWSSARATYANVSLSGVPVGLALSSDGDRVAVLTQDAGAYTVRSYRWNNGALSSALEYQAKGNASALAADADLTRLVVAGQFAREDRNLGGLAIFPFEQSGPLAQHFEEANESRYTSIGMSANGARLAAGTHDGRVLVFNRTGDTLGEPASFALGENRVRPLAVSADGSRVTAASERTLAHLDILNGFRLLWNTTIAGNASAIALNHTGGIALVGVTGSGGGAIAFGDKNDQPIWQRPGDTRAVAINAAGTQVAYAQKSFVTAASLPREIALLVSGGGKTSEVREVPPEGVATFEVQVRNPGAAPEEVVFSAPTDIDARITTQPERVLVYPDESVPVTLTVAVGPQFGQSRSFNLTARALTHDLQDNVTLSVSLLSKSNVTLFLNETEMRARPGETQTVLLSILNDGTSRAELTLDAEQEVSSGQPWNVTLEQESFTLLAGTRTSVRAHVTPPTSVANGTSNLVTFMLAGPEGSQAAEVMFRVNPTLSMTLGASPRVKFVEPGNTAHYNVTLANTGSLEREFEVFHEVTSDGGKPWAVDVTNAGTFSLAPGQSRTIPVLIVAPASAVPAQDRVSVLMVARSLAAFENDTVVSENLTLFANVEPPKPTTTTPAGDFIPFHGSLLAVAAAGFAAVVFASRRRQP